MMGRRTEFDIDPSMITGGIDHHYICLPVCRFFCACFPQKINK